jgi:signal transduction histidine kinase
MCGSYGTVMAMSKQADGQDRATADALPIDPQAATNALLRELRDRTRTLPGGLDDVALGEVIVGDVARAVDLESAALFAVDADNVWTLLACVGDPEDDLRALHGPVASETPTNSATGIRAAYELTVDDVCVGVLSCWRSDNAWTAAELDSIEGIANRAAHQLDSARLFREVHALATVEERQRLAREIHDGIAQEIASLGYVVDELVATAESPTAQAQLTELRGELSRIVTELRLSIFDLRSDIGGDAGLVAALSGYVRQVGATSDLTIHLVLAESTQRLRRSVEFELLRIAQEAITNVRRHAGARNLWVSCRIDPPHAYLRVADDGIGRGTDKSADSHGLDIMAERAARAGVSLVIRERRGGGTIVEIKTQGGDDGQTKESMTD